MITKSEKSHITLLRTIKPDLTTITNENISEVFDKLKTKHNEAVSDNYKISILRSLKKHNTDITKKPHDLKLKAKRNKKITDVDNIKFILNIIKGVYDLSLNEITVLTTRSIIDTYIAILLITCCFINIVDLYSLTEQDLRNLTMHQTINKTKKIRINALFSKAEPIIRELISHRNTLVDNIPTNKLISCSSNIINKTIKSLCIESIAQLMMPNTNERKEFLTSIGLKQFKFKKINILYSFLQ
ncbi:VLF-1 [Carcinus maenas nudivirus]|uniref:VLF-1 n=1 Tax=Carcinus maenas nudivirus TaxID=2880837 RepID=A0AAE8Y0K5_9VIRU|nr:VLF-1 [Carcinus maenas nudivirus]UBZ25670.1 VLF-1 [Carcinus maenas nudivirus]